MEAEYMGLTESAKEVLYLQQLLTNLGFADLSSSTIYNDNISAQKLAENHTFHPRSKHIAIRHHFIRDAVRNNQILIKYIPTDEMIADILTKALPGPKHKKCTEMLGLGSPVKNCEKYTLASRGSVGT